jgi:8-amino-7-oxononanoate synthase
LKDLKIDLKERKKKHLYRKRHIVDGPQQPEMVVNGRKVISFCSNDYLGLANDPEVKFAFLDGVKKYGSGSGSSPLVNGHFTVHHMLEKELAEFTGHARALLFPTGYMANLGIAQALVGKGDSIFQDRLNHASLIDGGLLSGAKLKRYAHNNPFDLEHKLGTTKKGEKLVLTDSVFSMDGDIANLPNLTKLCEEHDAWLMVDDAHGFGVLGKDGRGAFEHFHLPKGSSPLYMATLGKALGTSGAFVAGSEVVIETIIQKARTYIYTTATPPSVAAATRASLNLIKTNPQFREKLYENVAYYKECCAQTGLPPNKSETPIQPLIIGDDEKSLIISNNLFKQGMLVPAIRPPTVPVGTSRLRITLSSAHSHHQIDKLVSALTAEIN